VTQASLRAPRPRALRDRWRHRAWVVVFAVADTAGCAVERAAPAPAESEVLAAFRVHHAGLLAGWAATVSPGDGWREAARGLHGSLSAHLVGEALTDTFVEAVQAAAAMARAGTAVEVLGVDVERVALVSASARVAAVDADWRVRAIVRHGGHAHGRVLRAAARFTLDGASSWRIAAVQPRDLQRLPADVPTDVLLDGLDPDPGARGFLDPLELLRLDEGPTPP
jgi:hypothetical protein